MSLSTAKKRGFFLVFALWIFALMSLFCLGLGFRTFVRTKKARLLLNRTRAFYLALSGIRIANEILRADETSVDHKQEDWAQPFEKEERFVSPAGKGRISLSIEDEEARINLNIINRGRAVGLFRQVDMDDAEEKADCLFDYIDRDILSRSPSVFGCEDKENAKNMNFSVPEELLLVKNISVDDYKKIQPLVTVWGDSRININTAREDVLKALIAEDSLREDALRVRLGRDMIDGSEDDGYYGGEEGYALPARLTRDFKTTSRIFRVTSRGEMGGVEKKIVCVITKGSGKILYWNEN
ncbi:MAG: general secretion pathway protein GspK [Candidatus Omnitrophota bacterium]